MTFNIPQYPRPTSFSDPYCDWMYNLNPYNMLGKEPSEVDAQTLYAIFNDWLPIGTFEEMAPYVPRVLVLLAQDPPDEFADDLLETFIIWCHVEQEAMAKEENKAFLLSVQDALMQLFCHWAGQIAMRPAEPGDRFHNELYLSHNHLLTTLMLKGDEIAEDDSWRAPLPWLRSTHFLPILTALDSLPHAAWLLYLCDNRDSSYFCPPPAISVPAATRRTAISMVEDWLLSTASPEEVEIWDGIVAHTHEMLRDEAHPTE